MLRPQKLTMNFDFSFFGVFGPGKKAGPRPLMDISRDPLGVPVFFGLFSCVEFFTDRWIPIVARSGAERKDQYAELCDPGQM